MDLNTLLEKNENELLFDLGQALALQTEGKHALPPVDTYIPSARQWLAINKDKLAAIVCELEIINKICSGDDLTELRVEIVAAFADALAGMFIGIPPFTASTLIAKYYAKIWCCK